MIPDEYEFAARVIWNKRLARFLGVSVPELGELDWDLVAEYGDLMTAIDQINGQIQRENSMLPDGSPMRSPIDL